MGLQKTCGLEYVSCRRITCILYELNNISDIVYGYRYYDLYIMCVCDYCLLHNCMCMIEKVHVF